MAFRTLKIAQEFPHPLPAVFAYLSDHGNLGPLFGVPVSRIATSQDPNQPNGLGSVRSLKIGPVRIEETITAFENNRMIEYRVTRGGFLKHHRGEMKFSETPTGTRLDYAIEIESAIPLFTGPLLAGLGRGIRPALSALAKRGTL